jgi:PAS domain S-box-containing protein
MTAPEVALREQNSRLVDEVEQLKTTVENTQDELSALGQERDALRATVARQARDLQLAWRARSSAEAEVASLGDQTTIESERRSQTEEELRAAVEELQVLTEELEVSNATLREANQHLDDRVAERTAEIARASDALGESEARFRTLIEGMPQLVWRSQDGGKWSWCSRQWSDFTGLSEIRSLGMGWLDAVHPEDRPLALEAWAAAEASQILQFDARLYHADQERFRHFRTRALPVRDADGHVREWLGTSTDVNDITELRQTQGVLLAELQHRTRNLMGVVQSVVTRTLRGSSDLEDFGQRLEPRLMALSRVQGMLSRRGDGERLDFSTLVREELSAHVDLEADDVGPRVRLQGPPDVRLRSSSVQIFALGLHELATNALKYGALSSPAGKLTVSWEVRHETGGAHLHVVWDEDRGSRIDANPQDLRKGYGRELIERALPYQLGARTRYELRPQGVRCEIDAPLEGAS